MTTELDAPGIIALLGLVAHPEGGWYAESWRDEASSAIWFLLVAGESSRWHRVNDAAELWHYYLGDPLRLDICVDGSTMESTVLGPDLAAGHRPQGVVPAGAWQAATPLPTGPRGYTLVGCTVSPPFRFDAFELAPPGWAPARA